MISGYASFKSKTIYCVLHSILSTTFQNDIDKLKSVRRKECKMTNRLIL